jgi:hypothetical protein
MRKIIAAVASITAIAALVVPSLASASVQRYQTQTATFTATQPAGEYSQFNNVWTHNYKVTVNPCDNTFTGTGVQTGQDQNGPREFDETITGTFGKGTVSYTIHRSDGASWSLANAKTDGNTVTLATMPGSPNALLEFKATPPVFTNTSDYKNHGDYVSSQGGGDDAAHSCIGMPINSGK